MDSIIELLTTVRMCHQTFKSCGRSKILPTGKLTGNPPQFQRGWQKTRDFWVRQRHLSLMSQQVTCTSCLCFLLLQDGWWHRVAQLNAGHTLGFASQIRNLSFFIMGVSKMPQRVALFLLNWRANKLVFRFSRRHYLYHLKCFII